MNAIIDVNGEKIDFSRLNCVTFFPAEGDEIFCNYTYYDVLEIYCVILKGRNDVAKIVYYLDEFDLWSETKENGLNNTIDKIMSEIKRRRNYD